MSSVVRLQVDVGFGDAITPGPETVEFPGLLDFQRPILRAYPRATVVAEKVEAIVQLGLANSRMKDFFDVIVMSRMFSCDGDELARAIRSTFERRGTALPPGLPMGLTDEFAADKIKSRSGPVSCARPRPRSRWRTSHPLSEKRENSL